VFDVLLGGFLGRWVEKSSVGGEDGRATADFVGVNDCFGVVVGCSWSNISASLANAVIVSVP